MSFTFRGLSLNSGRCPETRSRELRVNVIRERALLVTLKATLVFITWTIHECKVKLTLKQKSHESLRHKMPDSSLSCQLPHRFAIAQIRHPYTRWKQQIKKVYKNNMAGVLLTGMHFFEVETVPLWAWSNNEVQAATDSSRAIFSISSWRKGNVQFDGPRRHMHRADKFKDDQ